MSRDPRLYVDDLVQCGERVLEYTSGMTFAAFLADRRTVDAVVRNLELIGEAVKHLPEAWKGLHPQVPWKQIAGLRDVVAHAYFAVDEELIWDVVTRHVPALLGVARKLLAVDDSAE